MPAIPSRRSLLPFRYNQYGLAFGGPLIIPKLYNGKNRTFFFGNWEQYNYIKNSQSITSDPDRGAAQRRFLAACSTPPVS